MKYDQRNKSMGEVEKLRMITEEKQNTLFDEKDFRITYFILKSGSLGIDNSRF